MLPGRRALAPRALARLLRGSRGGRLPEGSTGPAGCSGEPRLGWAGDARAAAPRPRGGGLARAGGAGPGDPRRSGRRARHRPAGAVRRPSAHARPALARAKLRRPESAERLAGEKEEVEQESGGRDRHARKDKKQKQLAGKTALVPRSS